MSCHNIDLNLCDFFTFSTVNDKVVVSRSCAYEDINAPSDSCMRLTTPSYIRTEFCETCGHDGKIYQTFPTKSWKIDFFFYIVYSSGCNGAETIIKNSAIMLIPIVISFLLAF